MSLKNTYTKQAGYSVIELLVAAGISGFLTLALAGIMANSKKNYDVTEATTSIQENARFAMKTIGYDVRLAGFYGCSKEVVNRTVTPVSGVTATGATLQSGAGDQMTISFADSSKGVLESTGSAYEAAVTVAFNDDGSSLSPEWVAGAEIIVGDCGGAEVVTIDSIASAAGTVSIQFTPALERNYLSGVTAMLFSEKTYEVKYRQEAGTDTELPSLFVTENGTESEVASGIEFLRFLYGIDDYQVSDDDLLPEHFTTWSDYQDKVAAGSNGKVVSVQIGLLAQSVSDAYAKNGDSDGRYGSATSERTDFQVLDINTSDDKVGDADGLNAALETEGLTRQVFTNTLAIRNNTTL